MKRILLALLWLGASLACPAAPLKAARSVSLDGTWTLDFWKQGRTAVQGPDGMAGTGYRTIPATVPGNVELDLLAAGLAENPEVGSNVYKLRPWEGYQWRYSRTFATPDHAPEDCLELDFGGIDCYADIWLNGRHVASNDNMLIPCKIDVSGLLQPIGAENRLEVYIRSTVLEVRKEYPPVFSYNWGRTEAPWVRKAAHSFGWDIMPRLVSAGLWRSVRLNIERPVHIRDVHWTTRRLDTTAGTADIAMDYVLALPVDYQEDAVTAEILLSYQGETVWQERFPVRTHAFRHRTTLSGVHFWWPRGFGEPALYEAVFRLRDANGRLLDEDVRRIGIRTIRLQRSEVHTASRPGDFRFIVNGEPVFIKGSNWTPLDALHSRDPQHLERAFALVTDLNCNMLRCWGGNVYEDEPFYELCDAAGVMIWQDFSMGCTAYPQTLAFRQRLERELYTVVRRLRNHPCVALWAGNNEDDVLIADGDFKAYRPDPNRDRVTREIIPSVLFDLDPTRDYLPSSPYWSPELVREHYSAKALPEDHLWGPRGYYKDPFYAASNPLFASETGYHGMPCRESLEQMFSPECVYPWTASGKDEFAGTGNFAGMEGFVWNEEYKTKAVRKWKEDNERDANRNNLMLNQVRILFGEVPTDLDDFIFASQSMQGEAVKYFIELFRGGKFDTRTGILWWNIRDGWPIISDAVTDWYFRPKRAYQYIRNAQADVCAMILDAPGAHGQEGAGTQEGAAHPLVAVNDTREAVSGQVTVRDAASGRVVWKGSFRIPANGRAELARLTAGSPQGVWLISCTVDGARHRTGTNHYLYGEPPFRLSDYRAWLNPTVPDGVAVLK